MRIGIGYDVHALVPGRSLVLGGVRIPYELGLQAHSDGDVLAHALCDALLGAAGLGDIGQHFPDTDPAYKDADSLALLARCAERVRQEGYAIASADTVLIAQKPKLAAHRDDMRAALAQAMAVEPACINVKFTTTEGLGFIGRGEGMAAQAVCLLEVHADGAR